MAIIINRPYTGTTSDLKGKPMTCHTCKQRKPGVFGVDANGNPRCFDCMPPADREIFRQEEAE